MKFENIKTGDKVSVRIIDVVPEAFPGRPKKVKSVKKGKVIFKNHLFFTMEKENGLKESFSNAEMTCGEVEVKNV